MPYYTKSCNYNIFVQLIYSYFRYNGGLPDVLYFLFAVSFMKNQEGKMELQEIAHRRVCVRDISFLAAHPYFYVIHVIFCHFFRLIFFSLSSTPILRSKNFLLHKLAKLGREGVGTPSLPMFTTLMAVLKMIQNTEQLRSPNIQYLITSLTF